MKQPVRTPCSHTFDRVSIEPWFKSAPNARELRQGRYTLVKRHMEQNPQKQTTKNKTATEHNDM